MIKSIINPITGQSFIISNDTPFSVITDIIYFIVQTMSLYAQTIKLFHLRMYRMWFARFRHYKSSYESEIITITITRQLLLIKNS